MDARDLLPKLVNIAGPSGFEDAVGVAIRDLVSDLGETRFDAMGNLVLRLAAPAGAPSVMLMAHMDEVGLLVKYVDEDGFVYCEANGLIDERTLLATKVDIWTDDGPRLGVVGVKSRHLLSEAELRAPLVLNDLWVDIGASSADDAKVMGVSIGKPVTFHPTRQRLGDDILVSKAVDDRAGCAALIDVAHRMAAATREVELIFVWSTQEEVGSRGARVAAQWIQPTISVVVDTMPANDPTTPRRHASAMVGQGPVIRAQDSRAGEGTLYSVAVRRHLEAVASQAAIPYQVDVFPTWTDACGVHLAGRGVPTGGVFIPRRCSHSPAEVIDLRDLDHTADLLSSFLGSLDATAVDRLATRPIEPLATGISDQGVD